MNTNETDEKLVQALQAGDQSAFQQLFRRHYPSACQAIRRFLPNRAIIEDLAQDVFVRLWERRDQLNIQTSFGAYLRRSAINEALMYLRRQKKNNASELDEARLLAASDNAHDVMVGADLQQQIRQAIDSLPPRCRTIFLLSRHEEMSYREIAERLTISIKTVENQMVKALRILREQLGEHLCWLLWIYFF